MQSRVAAVGGACRLAEGEQMRSLRGRPDSGAPAGGHARGQWDPRRTTRAHGALPLVVTAALLVIAVCTAGVVIERIDHERRTTLTMRVESRHALARGFVTAYLDGVMEHERQLASALLAGPVSSDTFARINQENGYAAAVLLDEDGNALSLAPAAPELVGEPLATRYAHLEAALAGKPAVSNVVLSAVTGEPIIAFAVPFDTPAGVRVFSAGHRLAETPITAFIDTALSLSTSRALLVDAGGTVIASSDEDILPGSRLSERPDLALAASVTQAGMVEVDGEETFAVAGDVDGTQWRLVFTAQTRELLAPVSGPGRWVPWGILLAFTVASLAALAMWRRAQQERRSRLAYEVKLHELALSDPLTGLANRRVAVDRLRQALGRAQRSQNSVAVLYVDVDEFKSINDRYGHAIGDAVLVAVAERMRATFRVEDTIARLGGDEFVIICEDQTDIGAIDIVATRTREALGMPYIIGELTLPGGASVGVTTAATGETPDSVLARADRAMYVVKADRRALRELEAAAAAR